MYIQSLQMHNFRNYKQQSLEFSPKTNIIYGLNGQGKTNIIEALYFFCNGKSYRTAKDGEVVRFDEKESKIKILFDDEQRQNSGEIIISDKKVVKINDIPLLKLSEIVGLINMVIFTPDMLNIIKEGPGVRRQFLDILISQLKPVYFKTLLCYYKVLMSRNNILKSGNKAMLSTLDVWNEKLADYGCVIAKYRSEMINILNCEINNINFENQNEHIDIQYCSSIKNDFCDKQNFIKQLERNFERETEKGITLCGPQRDDFEILMGGNEIKKYGSQGQMRTCVLKMKLAECEIIKNMCGKTPVLLLDDILSELDEKRKEFFLNNIKDKQIFITCTQKEILKNDDCRYFHVHN
ncbi:MAG: DNA replication/repair protein RecF, partial [Clostridia bacterium]|nr:DNA replication/repair protein RecF [Clostridia bacterium]